MSKTTSWKIVALWGIAFVMAGSIAMAQADKKLEVGVNFGYTLSEGVDINPTNVGFGTVHKVNPTNGMSWGFNFDYLATENFSIGFLWDDQSATLNADIENGNKIDLADNHTYNYHGVFTFNLGEADAKIRPYFFGGLGATHFSGGDVLPPPIAVPVASNTQVESATKFSTTWGGGVKFMPAKNVGFKLEARWTPTYIKTDPAGWWCGGYWGCWPVGDSDYSNQLKLAAHVFFAF